jgi:hypothetical protein
MARKICSPNVCARRGLLALFEQVGESLFDERL